MKATDQIKHAAFEKTLDYLLEDPERNATKIMDMLDKVAPADLFPSQRTAFRNAIDQQSNWYQLITRLLESRRPYHLALHGAASATEATPPASYSSSTRRKPSPRC